VGRHRIDLDVHLLESGIDVGEIFKLRRADEGEIGGIEEENRPLALHVSVGDVDELAVLERSGLKGFEGRIENGHEKLLGCREPSSSLLCCNAETENIGTFDRNNR